MARIGDSVLGVLARIYNPEGGVMAPSLIEFAQPIHVVHDVSRETEIASGYGLERGYFLTQVPNAHAVANTQYGATSIFANSTLYAGAPDYSEIDCFVFPNTAMIYLSGGAFTSAEMALGYPNGIPVGGLHDHLLPLLSCDSVVLAASVTGGAQRVANNANKPPERSGRPIWCPPESTITLKSISTGALDVTASVLCWVGPRGALPPGLS